MITLFNIRPKGFNIGNDLIHLGLHHLLQEAFGEVVNVIPLPATSRYESQAKAGLSAKTIHEINQYGDGVIVGGGNLYENGELEVNLDALEALEAPLLLFSLSRGRIYNRRERLVPRTDAMPDRVASALNRKAGHSLARDKTTLAYLHGLGHDKVRLGGCPTLFLDQVADRLPPLAAQNKGATLVSVRNPALMNLPLRRQSEVYGEVRDLLELLRRDGRKDLRLLCHDHRDIPFAASFSGIEYIYTADVYTYLALLRSASLSVSYRLHATLPCLVFGTPAVAITYDERARSVMDTIGLGGWDIDLLASKGLAADVADRLRRLDELPGLKAGAQGIWRSLHETTLATLREFAADVRDSHSWGR